jgi:hydrogenase expression/formation protein HypE
VDNKHSSNKRITLAHGNGGKLSHELYESLISRHFDNPMLAPLADAAIAELSGARFAFTTDSYVVKPAIFPGGDIGKLAVCGTINDLSVMGASPAIMSCGLIIEESFEYAKLDAILASMAETARSAGVSIATGDTKVVEHGSCDGIFINTSGIGFFPGGDPEFSCEKIMPGDTIILTGTIGDHGMAILTAREAFPIRTGIESDCAPLSGLIRSVLQQVPPHEV